MARQIFYSFHFDNDVMRVQQIRQIGAIEGNKPVTAQKWEEVKNAGDATIKKWIEDNMKGKSCVVVLVGKDTSKRPWVEYEIKKAWADKKPLLGIYIHNISCARDGKCSKGANPFANIKMENGKKLSDYVKCHDPSANNAYKDIADNIENWIDTAVSLRT